MEAVQQSPTAAHPFSEGAHSGRLKISPSLNPYPFGSDEYKEWYRGWFNEVGASLARRPEPRFAQQWEGAPPLAAVTLSTIVAANADDAELCDWAKRADVGDDFATGGGAAPACVLRRVA